MKKCQKCGAQMAQDDVFCSCCGTKYDPSQQNTDSQRSSLFLKYSSYLDDAALYNVACAKENGIIKSDFPGEAEMIFEHLAIKNHTDSMFHYAMIQLNKPAPNKAEALKWLRLAAEKGHAPSDNYLKTHEPTPMRNVAPTSQREGILSGEEIYEGIQNAAVEIIAIENNKNAYRASGFIISNKGFIITNAHAILDEHGRLCKDIAVKLGDKVLPALPIAYGDPADGKHNSVDIALLFVPGVTLPNHVMLGDYSTCKNGQKVYLIGNSLGNGICITSGIISDVSRDIPGLKYPYIMTDAAANHGNSGGPLLNEQGEVIGVLVAGIENAEGMNYAIPVDMVKAFLEYIISNTKLNNSRLIDETIENYSFASKSVFASAMFKGLHLALDVIEFIVDLLI